MVPSWTETLLACGAEVVGRTRYCVHPDDRVGPIAKVGGTKDIDWEKLRALDAELLLLDREENPVSMRDQSPIATLATHVERVGDVSRELVRIAEAIGAMDPSTERLRALATRWRGVCETARSSLPLARWSDLPGVTRWLVAPPEFISHSRLVYVIWRDPWMCVGRDTFIASVFESLGFDLARFGLGDDKGKYPAFALDEIPSDTVLLFSSEPFPFHRYADELSALGRPAALVDGESFSWFGVRSLAFLEAAQRGTTLSRNA